MQAASFPTLIPADCFINVITRLCSEHRESGPPREIRTPDTQVRSLVLYPAELWADRFSILLALVVLFEPRFKVRVRATELYPAELWVDRARSIGKLVQLRQIFSANSSTKLFRFNSANLCGFHLSADSRIILIKPSIQQSITRLAKLSGATMSRRTSKCFRNSHRPNRRANVTDRMVRNYPGTHQ